jgi:cyclomaltodextrinase / maltogenic alpha-amylase / neopullulanase
MAHLSDENYRQLRPGRPFHLSPGAQPLSSTITLRLDGIALEPEVVLLDVRRDTTWRLFMTPADETNSWQATLRLPDHPTIIEYHFEIGDKALKERRQIESQNTDVGNRPVYGEWHDVPFKIAVYDPEQMPARWTQGMVVYQIFPDRFAKAQSDDAARDKMKGVYGHEPVFKSWGDRPEDPPLGRDFFGGDLRGIIDRLDYLKDLGVECLYLNPIFEASSNHRYEAIDFLKIEQMLGTEADFDRFIAEAQQRGLRVVLDAVFNHCSSDSIYFDITGKYGDGATQSRQSPYYRWFNFHRWPDQYDGWIGLGFMPEFVECPEVMDFFLGAGGVTQYWLDKGIDGWRADVPFDNSDDFWLHFRQRVNAVKPDAWTIAEEWRDATNYLLGDMFNGTMNYRLAWNVRGFFAMDYLSPSQFDDRLQAFLRDTPPQAVHSQMNLLDSHDTDRLLTVCRGDRARFKQAFAFLFAFPGAPTLFYGTEAALEGNSPEDSRRCMPWDDLDEELVAYFTQLMTVRRDNEVLRHGEIETVYIDDDRRVYGMARVLAGQQVIALFNVGQAPAEVQLPVEAGTTWQDLLNEKTAITAEADYLRVTLPPRGSVWLAC